VISATALLDRLRASDVTLAVDGDALDIEGPVPCPEYTEKYYAVFFKDPDGNRLEVVYR